MRLLLTSNGLTNTAVDRALEALLDKPVSESAIVFVITAANPFRENKSWLVDDLRNVKRQGFAAFDIIDIAGLPPQDSVRRMEDADAIMFGGGDAFYLMDQLERTGIGARLPELLQSRVYVGISAGSIVAGPDLDMSSHCETWGVKGSEPAGRSGLGLTKVRVRPHFESALFPEMTEENISPIAANVNGPVYALDDQTALVDCDGTLDVAGKGRWVIFD